VAVVWALSIIVYAVLIETTLFYGKIFVDVSYSTFLKYVLKARHRFTIWVRVFGDMAKKIR